MPAPADGVLASQAALALNPERTVFQYGCENWSRRNGLPVSGVKAIAQTADGYLWLGTQQGLVEVKLSCRHCGDSFGGCEL